MCVLVVYVGPTWLLPYNLKQFYCTLYVCPIKEGTQLQLHIAAFNLATINVAIATL